MQRAHVECSQHAWSMLLVKHCLMLVQHQHCLYLEVQLADQGALYTALTLTKSSMLAKSTVVFTTCQESRELETLALSTSP